MNLVKHILQLTGNTQLELAKALNTTQSNISNYVKKNRFPLARLIELERVTGIPRHELAPELFEGYVPISASSAVSEEKP